MTIWEAVEARDEALARVESTSPPWRARRRCVNCGAEYEPCYKPQRYCSTTCVVHSRITDEERWSREVARFWTKVDKGDGSGCWLWTRATDRKGYGMVLHNLRMGFAHRVSWKIANGPIPIGLFVCHHCDTPACVRPDHLFLGTNADNVADMVAKGRQARGERTRAAKLTPQQVLEIRAAYAAGQRQKDLADRYGVVGGTISFIVNGKNWAHVA